MRSGGVYTGNQQRLYVDMSKKTKRVKKISRAGGRVRLGQSRGLVRELRKK